MYCMQKKGKKDAKYNLLSELHILFRATGHTRIYICTYVYVCTYICQGITLLVTAVQRPRAQLRRSCRLGSHVHRAPRLRAFHRLVEPFAAAIEGENPGALLRELDHGHCPHATTAAKQAVMRPTYIAWSKCTQHVDFKWYVYRQTYV